MRGIITAGVANGARMQAKLSEKSEFFGDASDTRPAPSHLNITGTW
jgi:hypothetical protein